jgi:hypothetical protein
MTGRSEAAAFPVRYADLNRVCVKALFFGTGLFGFHMRVHQANMLTLSVLP